MHGVDLDQHMIDVAKKNFPNDEFIQGNMVTSMKLTSYDLITCFGNTLPHLKLEELYTFFNHIFDTLSPDGYFIVTMLNYDQILESKPSKLPVIKRDNLTFERYYTYQEDRIIFKTVLYHNHQQTEDETILFPYTKSRLQKIISDAKLKVTFYKNIRLDAYDVYHSHICMIITK
jgi:trans-aconitate methyltransferase